MPRRYQKAFIFRNRSKIDEQLLKNYLPFQKFLPFWKISFLSIFYKRKLSFPQAITSQNRFSINVQKLLRRPPSTVCQSCLYFPCCSLFVQHLHFYILYYVSTAPEVSISFFATKLILVKTGRNWKSAILELSEI
jgi:hypothetical protein